MVEGVWVEMGERRRRLEDGGSEGGLIAWTAVGVPLG